MQRSSASGAVRWTRDRGHPQRLLDWPETNPTYFRRCPGAQDARIIASVSERWTLSAACLAAVASALVGGLLFDELGPGQAVLGLVIQVIATAVVLRWRAAVVPAWCLTVVTATLAYAPIDWQRAFESQVTVWVPIMAAYAAARLIGRARNRTDVISGGTALLTWLIIMVNGGPPELLASMGAAAPLLAGISFALWQRLRLAREDRLAQMAREREMAARERIAVERSRMAADLHDLVTHEMVRVVLQARRLGDGGHGPDVVDAADEIAETASQALSQMRDFLSAVREGEDRRTPTEESTAEHFADELDALIAKQRSTGQQVHLSNEAPADLQLTETVSRCFLRAAQEGLVNAAKHASGVEASVTFYEHENGHVLLLSNPVPVFADNDELAGSGSGTGLRGIASRVRLLGGTMTARELDGQFCLRVEFPAAETSVEGPKLSVATVSKSLTP